MALPLEDFISSNFLKMVGDPVFVGIGIIGIFTGFVMVFPTHPALKALAILGAFFLAAPFMPFIAIIAAMIFGGIVALFFGRLWQR